MENIDKKSSSLFFDILVVCNPTSTNISGSTGRLNMKDYMPNGKPDDTDGTIAMMYSMFGRVGGLNLNDSRIPGFHEEYRQQYPQDKTGYSLLRDNFRSAQISLAT